MSKKNTLFTKQHGNENLTKIDNDFNDIVAKKNKTVLIEQQICSSFNAAVQSHQVEDFEKIVPLFKAEGIIPTNTTRKLLLICQIIIQEFTNDRESMFLANIQNWKDAIDKYIQIIFSLRRINLFSDTDYELEAVSFLRQNYVSPYAIIVVLSNELFEDFNFILFRLALEVDLGWDDAHQLYFLIHVSSLFPLEPIYLTISSIYLDYNDINRAYATLKQITNPSASTLEYLKEMELLIHES